MPGRPSPARRRSSWVLLVLPLVVGGLGTAVAASEESGPGDGDAARNAAADMARALAREEMRQRHPIDRLKLGELGVPDLIGGVLSAPVTDGAFAGAVIRFVELNKAAFGLESPASDLQVRAVERDELGMTHVRLRQHYRDLPVMYGDLRAHFSAEHILRRVNGVIFPDIALETTPAISAEVARAQVAAELSVDPRAMAADLVVSRFNESYHLVWLVRARVQTPPGRWEYCVNALTGEVMARTNRITYETLTPETVFAAVVPAGPAIGIGVGVLGNEQAHIDTYFDDSSYLMVDYTRQANTNVHGHNGAMPDTSTIRTYRFDGQLPGQLLEDEDNIWGELDQAAAVDAHVYAGMVYDFLLANTERNGFDNQGSSLVSTIADASCQNNAYWDGTQVSYCTVSSQYRAMSGSLDIVAHEWGHAVTEHASNLVYAREPGALNESFSDMMGVRLLFARGTPSWRIGEGFNGTGFRDMAYPRTFGHPDCYRCAGWINVENCVPSESNDFCGVHINSGVANKMFYLLSAGGTHNGRTVTGIGIDSAFKIMSRANSFYWTETSDLEDGKSGSISAAEDLDPTGHFARETQLAWEAVLVGVPANVPPVADPGGPYTGQVGSLVAFDGTGSYDPDGTITSYVWDFGNGNIGEGPMAFQVYAAEGSYTITLLVTDDIGAHTIGTTTAAIGPPSAVGLTSFNVVQSGDGVDISWRTAFEENHAGFHLHRREPPQKGFTRITARLLPAGDGGRTYEHADRTVAPGRTYAYRLEAVDLRGESQFFDLGGVTIVRRAPAAPALHAIRPNPFNARTTIDFELPAAARVTLRIYDGAGRLVRLMLDADLGAGIQSIEWDGRGHTGRPLDSGVYFCRLEAGSQVLTTKVVLVQ